MAPSLLKLAVLALSASVASAALPVLPIATAAQNSWPAHGATCGGGYCGDVRAIVVLSAGDIVSDSATVQIWWRRRDPNPDIKGIIVLDDSLNGGFTVSASTEKDCGLVTFSRKGLSPGTYQVYYLPFSQSGGGAGLAFSWYNCSDQSPNPSNLCVRGRRLHHEASVCAAVDPSASAVVGIENRDDFNAFSVMEQMATDDETAAAAQAVAAQSSPSPFVAIFPEDAAHSVRVFDAGIPARWALSVPSKPAFTGDAAPGQFLVFQLGLWAFSGAFSNLSYAPSNFIGPQVIESSNFIIINMDGINPDGSTFSNTAFGLAPGMVGSLWCGLSVPLDATAGSYSGSVTLAAQGVAASLTVPITINVVGAPVADGGAGDIYSMARLSWLNSARGLEDTVPAPFIPVSTTQVQGSLVVGALRKSVVLSAIGLPVSVSVDYSRVRMGVPETLQHSLFSGAVDFAIFAPGSPTPLPQVSTKAAVVTQLLNSSVTWAAAWTVHAPTGDINVSLAGKLDFTSVVEFAVSLTPLGAASVTLGDVQLIVPVSTELAGYIVGMDNSGAQATTYENREWRWTNTTGANKVFVGRPEAGIIVNLKGDGPSWDSPMFGNDYPVIPYVPTTWGGVDALPSDNNNGVNVTNGTVTAFSGPRTLLAGATTTFRFNLHLLPSRSVNWTAHWATRTQQLGYDVAYASPADVAARGVTVVTIHQGCPGIVNGSLINPWINYPFLNDTVPLLTNFTEQSNALGMGVKFYYTIRELSARAPEMFAFKAMQGEILVDQDPWVIVQPGYAHNWNTHGGAAFLHQHMGTHYGACWQQSESNGEIDPSMCSHGVSRLFNYYVEGLAWSFSHAPFINGIATGKGFPALLDLHTGREGTPDTCSYASHYPLVDYIWNGEGFDFGAPPPYWLLEISTSIHGITGDMLGSGERSVFRGLVFGMTQRDAVSSQAIWRTWDATRISETDALFGWWEIDGPHAVNITLSTPQARPAASTCNYTMTKGSYKGSANEQCLQPSGPTPGCWAVSYDLATVEAACCADAACAGFSYNPSSQEGCCKIDQQGSTPNSDYNGYTKNGWVPPRPPFSCVLATVWSKFASHSIVAVANWCGGPTNITLDIDFDALGLNPSATNATLPDIDGVQAFQQLATGAGPFELDTDGGIFLHLVAQ